MRSTSTSALRQSGVLGIPVLKTQSIALLAVQHRWSQFLQGRTWICCEASFQIIRGGVKYNSNGYAISLLSVYSVWCSVFLKDAPYSWKLPNVCWKGCWNMNVNHHLWAWYPDSFKLLKNICMTYPTKWIKSFLLSEFLSWWCSQCLLVDLNNCLSAGISLADSSDSHLLLGQNQIGLDDYGSE